MRLPRSLLALLAGLLLLCAGLARAEEMRWVAAVDLPPEARATLELIARGGPFPHKRDDIVFNNFEQRLPRQQRDYYREYTVATPGVKHRGARRIVCGGERRRSDACWYTADHYRSFRKIRE